MRFFNTVTYDGTRTAELLSQSVKRYCVTYLSNVPDHIDLKEFYAEMGASLGLLVLKDEDPETGLLHDGVWSDIAYTPENAEKAYRYSDKHHSLQTDYSYVPINLDMTFFFCLKPAHLGGATIFVDSEVLQKALVMYDRRLFEALCSIEVPLSKAATANNVSRTVRIIQPTEDGLILNWNYHRAKNAEDAVIRKMVEDFHQFLESKVLLGGLYSGVMLKKGEGCFIHDQRVLHGRLSFIGERHLCKGAIALQDAETVSEQLSGYPHAS